ncbi:glutamine synthetase family protein [Streptomyces hainanensis]|uniref:Glutamine synthetase n=1 Tax=Streptomyces hainanensis TaxID=402648 RepID=A0A4R4TLM1_9ACTN|nr:glutamine synthetase family protein [Streptomyces hainanensis]TDC76684.1 glutamine synthetase [Streptomyces hainanensis]
MEPEQQLTQRLSAARVSAVALTWVDNAGLTRVKAVPVGRLTEAVRRGVGMSPVFDVFLVDDSITSSPRIGGPDGDLRLVPDLERLTVLAGQPGWAWAPADRYEQTRAPYVACQRGFARRQADRALAEHGLELRMGFETEWAVTRPGDSGDGRPPGGQALPGGTGPAYGMSRLVGLTDYLRDLTEAFAAQGLPLLQLHPEYSPGQFEISARPAAPVAAADDAVLVRETIRAVSNRHGLHTSFAPVADLGGLGNGRHLHLSLWRGGKNACRDGDGPYGMSGVCEAFLAGVLRELPALLAIGAPTPASYLRLRPSVWAGAFQCWGLENREAAVRFVTGAPDDQEAANAEVKCFDGAANPYLLVGAVIAAGLAGVGDGLTLPQPVSGDPAERHVSPPPRLPESLPAALDQLESSTVLRTALGEELYGAILAVRQGEVALFAESTPDEIVAATRERY